MSDICKLCNKGPNEWPEDEFEAHLRAQHNEASVRAMYGDEYSSVFDETTSEDREDEVGEEERDSEPETQSGIDMDESDSYGKKWYMIGVGGAGNNIIDAILLRRATLERNNEDRAQVWKGGLAGFGSLNTNVAELEQTYYAQVVRDFERADILSNAIIGFGRSSYSGAGYRWDIGQKLMEADFEDSDPFVERWDMTKTAIRDAQAVMFLHSVTKGTGCGATPVLANFIREEVLDDSYVVGKPMLSSVVLPSEGSAYSEFGGRAKTNGVVGLTRLSEAVDAIIPFDNARLKQVQADIRPRIENIEAYNPPHYAELNRPLVAFLEAFTMSSIPQFL
ncbi:MAG: cell division protein FtsZ, partial [Halobacteriaceae archaeon]